MKALGKIIAVDTATVTVRVDELERLKRVQVNRLTAIRSSKAGQHSNRNCLAHHAQGRRRSGH
jgi:hypothetical protein